MEKKPKSNPPKNYGKGSGRRKESFKSVQDNWSNIKGFKPSKYK